MSIAKIKIASPLEYNTYELVHKVLFIGRIKFHIWAIIADRKPITNIFDMNLLWLLILLMITPIKYPHITWTTAGNEANSPDVSTGYPLRKWFYPIIRVSIFPTIEFSAM